MSSQPVASVASAPGPIEGNNDNSSPNFQFVQLPASGQLSVQISDNPNASDITFTLWHVRGGRQDKSLGSGLGNGSSVSVSDVEMGANYYVGNPSNAGDETFVMTLLADFG